MGRPLENRARLLVACVKEAKAAAGPGFSVSVKLNSADFQKGGFSFEDCLGVIDILDTLNVDFVEISGGNYEQPKMMDQEGLQPAFDQPVAESTRAREAYFLKYARAVQDRAKMPLMVTGGFRTVAAMNDALAAGEADLIGLGRPLCVDTAAPARCWTARRTRSTGGSRNCASGPACWGRIPRSNSSRRLTVSAPWAGIMNS
jgi:2,4-dienoyl-CoA reductase-like NADH-dependent reductase (Old Yellow Enzyme family)